MEERSQQDGIGLSLLYTVEQLFYRSRSSGSDHGNIDGLAHGPGELQIVTGLRPVPVDGVEKDLSGPEFPAAFPPVDGIDPRVLFPAVGAGMPPLPCFARINGDDNALTPERKS